MRMLSVIATTIGLCLAAPAGAQDLASLCETVERVEVGQWAEYETSGKKSEGSTRMRLAVIGSEKVEGATAYWIEMQMSGDRGAMITQVLAEGYPYEPDDIKEMVVKTGDQPAMKVPRQALGMMRGRMGTTPSIGASTRCDQAKVLGRESVTVPAGEFSALQIEPVDARSKVWAVENVPFGMVKMVSPDLEIRLVGHGRDAKSSISETPQTMPGMGGR